MVLSQDFTDVYHLNVGSVYQEASSQLHKDISDRKLHLEETGRLHDKATESKAKFAEHRQYFYETVALTPVLFSISYEIVDITKTLSTFENIFGEIILREEVRNLAGFKDLDNWRNNKITEVNHLILKLVYLPIGELLNRLESDLSQTR